MPVTDHHETPEPLFKRGCGAECALCPDEFQDGHSNHDFTAMNAIHKERLLKLADFLDTIPKDKFDFGHVVNKCHTVGCAMGWCPVVFPDLVKYLETEPLFPPTPNEEHYHDVQTIDEECQSYDEVAAEIFGLPSEVGLFLFTANFQEDLFPGEEESEKATKMNRGNNASASEVAEMLRQFLRYVEDGTINLDDF